MLFSCLCSHNFSLHNLDGNFEDEFSIRLLSLIKYAIQQMYFVIKSVQFPNIPLVSGHIMSHNIITRISHFTSDKVTIQTNNYFEKSLPSTNSYFNVLLQNLLHVDKNKEFWIGIIKNSLNLNQWEFTDE